MSTSGIPTDNGREIPGVAELARVTTRLHPRPGSPTAGDSHLGGPLLWPADEPWPHCDGTTPPSGRPEEGWFADHGDVDVPVALVGVGQFFRRDFLSLPFLDNTDLLQVLWCPNYHIGTDSMGPAVHLVWRDSARVAELAHPPKPAVAKVDYCPLRPCELNPCQIVEYPGYRELPPEISSTLSFIGEHGDLLDDDAWPEVVIGSKLGGWAFWNQTDPWGMRCRECAAELRLLLAFRTWDSGDDLCSCEQDIEDPVGWEFDGEGSINIFTCANDSTHPFAVHID